MYSFWEIVMLGTDYRLGLLMVVISFFLFFLFVWRISDGVMRSCRNLPEVEYFLTLIAYPEVLYFSYATANLS